MACSNGSEPKPDSPPHFIVSVGDSVCALYGADSIMCQYSKGGLGDIIPNAWVDTAEFCNGPPSAPDSIDITDFPTGWVSKVIGLAKSQKWGDYCQCKLPPPPPPPFPGGQCDCAIYYVTTQVTATTGGQFGPRTDEVYGPIGGAVAKIIGNNVEFKLICKGPVTWQGCQNSQDYGIGTIANAVNNNVQDNYSIRITNIGIHPAWQDNCGDPPPPPPPPREDEPIPPAPPVPPNLPPAPPPPGPSGPPGPPGPMGDCSQCPPGPKGDQGDTGNTGLRGDSGPIGPAGKDGSQGPMGLSGPQGIPGPAGSSGADGSIGPQGPQGERGTAGTDGLPGPKGDPGLPGKDGLPGPKGEDAVIEYQDYEFEIHQCIDGEEQVVITQLPVIKPDLGGSGVELFQAIFDTIYNRTRTLGCRPTANVPPAIIGSGVSSQLVPVFYIDIDEDVRSVILLITGDLPKGLRKYRLQGVNEDEASFGHIGFATTGPDNSLPSEQATTMSVLTRATLYRIPSTTLVGKVRISLWENLSWTLYDSGER